MINRISYNQIKTKLNSGKAIIIVGARQTGKTTLLHQLLGELENTLWLSGDDPDVQSLFSTISSSRLKTIFAGKKTIVIDEAQRIADIGLKLKLITET